MQPPKKLLSMERLKEYVQQPSCVESYEALLHSEHTSIHELVRELFRPSLIKEEEEELLISVLRKALALHGVARQLLEENQPLVSDDTPNPIILRYACCLPRQQLKNRFLSSQIYTFIQSHFDYIHSRATTPSKYPTSTGTTSTTPVSGGISCSANRSSSSINLNPTKNPDNGSQINSNSILRTNIPPTTESLYSYGLIQILNRLALSPDLTTAAAAEKAILELCRHEETVKYILNDEFITSLEEGVKESSDSEVQIRLLHMFVSMGEVSETIFGRLEKSVYRYLLDVYFSDDLLIKLNVIQFIWQLGSTRRGMEYLSKEGIPLLLARDLAEDSMVDDSAKICLLHVLSHIMQNNPSLVKQILIESEEVVPKTMESFLDASSSIPNSAAMKKCALLAWARVCSLPEGFTGLLTYAFHHKASEYLIDGDSTISEEAMRAFTIIYSSDRLNPFPYELCNLAQEAVLPKVMDMLLRRPFGDTRVCCYELLTSLLRFEFMPADLCSLPDVLAVLLNNFSEEDIHSKYAKHSMVKAMVDRYRKDIVPLLDSGRLVALEKYVAGGPFFVEKGAIPDIDKQALQ